MNVDGYGTSSDEDDDHIVATEVGSGKLQSGPADVAKSPDSTTGGIAQGLQDAPSGTKRRPTTSAKPRKKKSSRANDPGGLDYAGPWAKSSDLSDQSDFEEPQPVEEREYFRPGDEQPTVPTELYVLEQFLADLFKAADPDKNTAFAVPRKVKATLRGHTKGVTKVRFCPHRSQLLLSSGNDSKIFLWSIATQSMLRGYFGHTQAVKDVVFSSDGTKFLSAGLDRKVILWDTQTGAVLRQLTTDAIPNAVIFNPNNENEIVVGLLSRRIDHYDLSLPEYQKPVQTYDHHLGAINSLLAVDSNTKFMSTSDDRTIRFWEWQINIPAKIIADPTQHSTPYAALHPTANFIALQMMDNSIQVIQGSGKFRYNRNKVFEGHRVAGYGIQIAILNDGEVVMSGDVSGYVFFWSWNTGKLFKKLKVSDTFVSCLDVSNNGVAVAGNSGDIYYCQ